MTIRLKLRHPPGYEIEEAPERILKKRHTTLSTPREPNQEKRPQNNTWSLKIDFDERLSISCANLPKERDEHD